MFSIRQGNWKYIEGQGSGGWSTDESTTKELTSQLYDLEADPSETINLIKQKPKLANELKERLVRQQELGYTRAGAIR
jgi:arylsulfatase A-like enzyme